MCLDVVLTDGRCDPLVAEEDIVCYKVLFTTAVMLADRVLKKLCESYDVDEDAEYMSPYRYAPYDIGKEYTSELDDVWPIHAHSGMVSKGLHTFVDYYEAVHRMNDSGRCDPLVAEEDIVCYKVLFTTAVMLADRVLKKLCESYDAEEDIVCYKVLFTTAVMLADRVLKKLCES